MSDDPSLSEIEHRTEDALTALEQAERWDEALEVYRAAGEEVDNFVFSRKDPNEKQAYREAKRIRSYLYMREANAYRALGRPQDAVKPSELSLETALASGDGISIARAMFSLGTTYMASGDKERGLKHFNDSKGMFEHATDEDHQQGLGWWYIIKADLRNKGYIEGPPQMALEAANKALELLRPLKNWPGVARAHEARAAAYDHMGDTHNAELARTAQKMAQEMVKAGNSHQ